MISAFFPHCDGYDEDVQTIVAQTFLQKEMFLVSMWANILTKQFDCICPFVYLIVVP